MNRVASSRKQVPLLTPEQLELLRRFTSPTIANAIETFQIRPREVGCTNHAVRCLFPQFGPMIGYAGTATIRSDVPPETTRAVNRVDYWRYLTELPSPRIVVMEDVGDLKGPYWGEVNGNIHRALGCIGVLTNGTVRDLGEVERLGFHLFGSGVNVSHYWAHLEDFGKPVKVFGMEVRTGDLIHADRHGAVVIPPEVAPQLAERAAQFENDERLIIDLCKSDSFSIEQLDRLVPPEY